MGQSSTISIDNDEIAPARTCGDVGHDADTRDGLASLWLSLECGRTFLQQSCGQWLADAVGAMLCVCEVQISGIRTDHECRSFLRPEISTKTTTSNFSMVNKEHHSVLKNKTPGRGPIGTSLQSDVFISLAT